MKNLKFKLLFLSSMAVAFFAKAQINFDALPSNVNPGEAEELYRSVSELEPESIEENRIYNEVREITSEAARRFEEAANREGGQEWNEYQQDMNRAAEMSDREQAAFLNENEDKYRSLFNRLIETADINVEELRRRLRQRLPSYCQINDFLCVTCEPQMPQFDTPYFPRSYQVQKPSESTDPPPPPPADNQSDNDPALPKLQKFVKKAPFSIMDKRIDDYVASVKKTKNANARGKYISVDLESAVGAGTIRGFAKAGEVINVPPGVKFVDIYLKYRRVNGKGKAATVLGGAVARSEFRCAIAGSNVPTKNHINNSLGIAVAPLFWYMRYDKSHPNWTFEAHFRPDPNGGIYLMTTEVFAEIYLAGGSWGKATSRGELESIEFVFHR